jgi:putative transposase
MNQHAKLTMTLRLPVVAGEREMALLLESGRRFTASFNRTALVGWAQNIRSSVDMHKATYRAEAVGAGLPSQLVISARMKAAEALKSVRDRLRKGRKASCPKS